MSRYAVAPPPPAEPGLPAPDEATDRYLSELARWRLRREHELRALDELTRSHGERQALEADLTSSMTLFHAIAQRHDLLLATWADVQGGEGEREWVAQLIWGVLELPDGDADALAVSMPDALRLSDALAGSLRVRVDADGEATAQDRLAGLDAGLERVRGVLAEQDGSAGEEVAEALEDAAGQVEALHGQDEPGLAEIGAAESHLVAVERELIVSAASHAHARADREQAEAERAHLVARGEAVRSLAQRVLDDVRPAPRLGIPDVTALGEVPEDEGALETYVNNLERVGRALEQAHATYAAALAEYADLADRAERLAKTLAGCGAPTSVDLAGMLTAAKESLHTRPADVQRASALIAAQEAYLAQLRPDA